MKGNYDDIINLPHHVSATHPRMSAINRAAQFAPFAALTGYDAAIKETARLTDRRIELDDHEKSALDEKLAMILERIQDAPVVDITFFLPDEKKEGGAYVTVSGPVKKIETYERLVIMADGQRIPITEIVEIGGGFFTT